MLRNIYNTPPAVPNRLPVPDSLAVPNRLAVPNKRLFVMRFSEGQVREIFRRCDSDGDGRLSRQELTNAFSFLGSKGAGWRAICALLRADKNGDGYISEAEFEEVVKYAFKRGYVIP